MTRLEQFSGRPESFWIASSPETNYRPLEQSIVVDVAILGGGIVGISTAYLLSQTGKRVAVIEAGRILKGVTGHTTAKITSQHGLIYRKLIKNFGEEQARLYAKANEAGLEKIASIIDQENIECNFTREPAHVFALSNEEADAVEDETAAAKDIGINAGFMKSVPLPLETKGAMIFPNQGSFHPRKYLLALAGKLEGGSSLIFENTRALDVKEGEPSTIVTDRGELRAKFVVIATHYPIYDGGAFFFARMYQSRSYVMAARIEESFAGGTFLSAADPFWSLRSAPAQNGNIIIASGGEHRTGTAEDHIKYYESLQDFITKIYKNARLEYHWSTQDNVTVDGVPYIGKITKNSEHVYVGTGFGKWGMTNGTVAAMLISDMILGKSSSWAELYNPSRFKPIASAKELASHVVDSAEAMLSRYVGSIPSKDLSELKVGSGELIKLNGERVAVYKDESGRIFKLKPFCQHMGCPVVWNNAENTWDCPCHGSRYGYDGSIVQEPTVKGLEPYD